MRCLRKGLLVGLLFLSGCAGFAPGKNADYWDQKVSVTGWGFSMMTMYGPFNIGYLQYSRNVDNPLTPASPSDVLKASRP